jgi:hypothetical protein
LWGQVQVNPRAKPYKSISLTVLNWLANFHVSQYPPCDQAGNLNTTDIKTIIRPDADRAPFIFLRGLIQLGVKEPPGMILALGYIAAHRNPV